jgi:hypothetical protein
MPAQVLDLAVHAPVLELAAHPLWVYDASLCANVWGNR